MLVFTGQHPKLDRPEYGLADYAAVRLDCPGQEDPNIHVGLVTKALLPVLAGTAPSVVVVQGDTSSALGGALAARIAKVPVAHVEAGLRSHDLRRPWPEEEFRVAIDRDAELLFAPTELSAANLRRERVHGRICVTGNTGIDAVLAVRGRIEPAGRDSDLPRLLVTCHRRENWRRGISGLATALREIASQRLARVEVLLHPNPELAGRVRELLFGHPGISLNRPFGHSETIAAMVRSRLVLSDSGGMQEEASALGVPLLVLREKTERPEAIAGGGVELVGIDPAAIVRAVRRRLAQAGGGVATNLFGDGRAGERIADVIEQWLGEREALSPRCPAVPRTAASW